MIHIKKEYCVYIHFFPNGKHYVGLTKQDVKARWGYNGSGYKDQPVYRSIQEFGWESIQHIIIKDKLTFDEAQKLEIELIDKSNSINNGYNVSRGGGLGGLPWTKIMYKGKLYSPNELLQFSTVDNLTSHDITTRISHGWNIEDVLNKKKRKKNIKYEYNGKLYSCKDLLKFSTVKDLAARDLLNRITHCHWDIERALTQPKNKKKQPFGCRNKNRECLYEYNGSFYKTHELLSFSNVKGLTVHDITTRINKEGWSVEDAITKEKKKRNQLFEYKGNLYSSKELAEISPVSNLHSHDITDRIRAGWSVEDAVNKPKRKSPCKK